jgi:RNA polymerase sigma-70 factor (ECF subfamily)
VTDANVPPYRAGAEPSSSLLQGVKEGDKQAWERLVKLYAPLVYVWCRRAGMQSADAADVGQEVFQAVARKVTEFRRDRDGDSFRAWVRTITRHKLYDHLRRRRLQHLGKEEEGQTAPHAQSLSGLEASSAEEDREELTLLYRRAVELICSQFEESTRRAFWAVVVESRPVAEVARELGMTANAVYLARSRVLRRLRFEFADLLDP